METASPLSLLQKFISCALIHPDAVHAIELLSHKLQLFMVDENNKDDLYDYPSAVTLIRNEITADATPHTITVCSACEQLIAPGIGNANLKAEVQPNRFCISCRIFASICLEENLQKICTLHISILRKQSKAPDSPLCASTPHCVQQLIQDYFDTSSSCGIIGGYFEDGFPLYFINSAMLHLLGFESKEAYALYFDGKIINSIHPEDQARVIQETTHQLSITGEYAISHRMLKKSGDYIWADFRGKILSTEDGRKAIVCVCFDTTKQRKEELVDAQKSKELINVVNSIAGGILI